MLQAGGRRMVGPGDAIVGHNPITPLLLGAIERRVGLRDRGDVHDELVRVADVDKGVFECDPVRAWLQ